MNKPRDITRTLIPTMPSANEVLPYLREIDDSRWYSNFGPLNSQLVSRLANYFQVDENQLCLIGNATLGLQAIAELIDVDPKSNFDLPSFTFAASPSSLISAKRRLRFLDIDNDMRCVPAYNSKVIMDVLPFGESIRVENWMNNLDFLIIDAAASFDALKSFGKNTKLVCPYALVVSLHSTKLLGAGEGGVVISSKPELIKQIKLWQNFGFDLDNSSARITMLNGTNAKMSEYSCAVALASFDKWDYVRSSYLQIQSFAYELSNRCGIQMHSAMRFGRVNPYWILIPEDIENRIAIERECRKMNFETRLWWQYGCHRMPGFTKIETVDLTNTEWISERYIGLPFHLHLPTDYWESISLLLENLST